MRLSIPTRSERHAYWHKWFAWWPVYLIDMDQIAWLETVWRREGVYSPWDHAAIPERTEDTQ